MNDGEEFRSYRLPCDGDDEEGDDDHRHRDDQQFEELDYRESDGLEISVLWNRTKNTISVLVVDTKSDEQFELPVPNERALDAFHQPFAYAAQIQTGALTVA